MRGLVVHTWQVTHSNVAEILPNGNLFTHNCGYWLEELTPDSKTVWRWEGDRLPGRAQPPRFLGRRRHDVVSLAARNEPVHPRRLRAGHRAGPYAHGPDPGGQPPKRSIGSSPLASTWRRSASWPAIRCRSPTRARRRRLVRALWSRRLGARQYDRGAAAHAAGRARARYSRPETCFQPAAPGHHWHCRS